MKLVKKLEKSIGRYAIPKLYFYIIIAIVIGYVLYYMLPSVYCFLIFNPYDVVVKHQYWRLFTWFFTIPYSLDNTINMLFLPINLYFYYFVGKSLENIFGRFSFNLYVFGGWFISTLGMLGTSFALFYISDSKEMYRALYQMLETGDYETLRLTGISATHYMLICIFFAFALIFGEMMVMLWFIIPFKIKWSAWIMAAFLCYDFLKGDAYSRVLIICFVMNFIIYYFIFRTQRGRSIKDIRRQMKYRSYIRAAEKKIQEDERSKPSQGGNVYKFPNSGRAIHKCAICGRTELDDPNLEFRYCSKCGGDYEYCSDHLYTHVHKSSESQ